MNFYQSILISSHVYVAIVIIMSVQHTTGLVYNTVTSKPFSFDLLILPHFTLMRPLTLP